MKSGNKNSDGGRRGVHFGYLVVFTLVLTSFLPLSLGLSCAGIFYTAVADSLHVGVGMLSYYISILWASTLVFLPLCGHLLARVDARVCISGAVAVMALDFVFLSQVNTVLQFYIGAFLMGIGVTMLLFLAPSTLVNRWFQTRAGFFIGIIMAFTGVGGVVWSAVGGALINAIGWQQTYVVFAVLCAATLPFTVLCISSSPSSRGLLPVGVHEHAQDKVSPAPSVGSTAHEAYRSASFYVILALAFCLNLGMGLYFLLPSYVATLPAGVANPILGAMTASVAMVGQTLSKIALGVVGDRKMTLGFMIGLGFGLAGAAVFLMGIASTAAVLYAAAFLYGFFYGVTNVMLPIATRRVFGIRDYSTIYARISMAASLGSIVSGFLWGTCVQIAGTYLPVFAGVSIVIALAIVLVMALSGSVRKSER